MFIISLRSLIAFIFFNIAGPIFAAWCPLRIYNFFSLYFTFPHFASCRPHQAEDQLCSLDFSFTLLCSGVSNCCRPLLSVLYLRVSFVSFVAGYRAAYLYAQAFLQLPWCTCNWQTKPLMIFFKPVRFVLIRETRRANIHMYVNWIGVWLRWCSRCTRSKWWMWSGSDAQ